MKFNRRHFLLGLTTSIFPLLYDNNKRVIAQMPPLLNSSPQPSDWLNNGQLNKDILYQHFLKLAEGGKEDQPKLLYQGVNNSAYQNQINNYPTLLSQNLNDKNLVSTIPVNDSFQDYPKVGEKPIIDNQGLEFLHEDIKEACVCLGSFTKGKFKTKWLGRNALVTGEFWSATKIIPLLYLLSRSDNFDPKININNYQIEGIDTTGNQQKVSFFDLAKDIISYEQKIASSNSLGAMIKRFVPQLELEKWIQEITGNQDLVFRGRYGEVPFIDQPQLINQETQQVILSSDSQEPRWACNEISAYDLTRIMSMIGWYPHLSEKAQLPGVTWQSLSTLIKALGYDPARLTDLALGSLGLEQDIDGVVILSKEGDGATGTRLRTEAVYVALINLIDKRVQPNRQMMMCLAMRGGLALNPRNLDQEVVNLDARMATEVTDLIWRVINNQGITVS